MNKKKKKFSIKDFFSKCDQICSLVKESLMGNFIFCAVIFIRETSEYHYSNPQKT